jgi:hypothetical protein
VEVRDDVNDIWEPGTVEGMSDYGLPLVQKLGYDTTFTWAYIRRAEFEVGDEVEVKDETDDEWEPGTVQDVADGGDPLVRKEGYSSAFAWGHIRRSPREDDGDNDDDNSENDVASSRSQSVARSVASSLAPSARTGDVYSVGDGVYVQDASGDDWQGSVQCLDGNGEPGRVLIWARNNEKAFKPRVESEPRAVLIHSRARNPTSPSKQRKRQEYVDARRKEVLIHARSRRPFSPAVAKRKEVVRTTPNNLQQPQQQQQQQPEASSSVKVQFAVGDLVDVKDATDEEWESGIVQGLDEDGAPKVRKEGFDSAFSWAHVRRSPVPGTRKHFVPPQETSKASASMVRDRSFGPSGAKDSHTSGNGRPPVGSCGHGVLRVYAVDFALSQGLSASPGGGTPTICELCKNGLAGARGELPTFHGCKKCRRAICLTCYLQQTKKEETPLDDEASMSSDDNDSSTVSYVKSMLNDDSSTEDETISTGSSKSSTSTYSEAPLAAPHSEFRPNSEVSSEAGGESSPRVADDNLRWAGTALTPAQVKQAWRDSWRSPNGTRRAHGAPQQQQSSLPRMNLDHKLGPSPPASDATSSFDASSDSRMSPPGKLRAAAGRHSSGGSSSRKKRREFAGKEYAVLGDNIGSMDTINASDSGSGSSSGDDDLSTNEKGYRSVASYSSEEEAEEDEERKGPWGEFGSGCTCCCGCIRCCVGTCCSRAKPGGKSLVDAEGASGCCAPGTVANVRRIGRIMLWIFPICYLLLVAYYVLYTDRIPKFMRRTYKPGRAHWSTVAIVLPLCGFLAALVGNTVPLSGGLIFLPVLIAFNITGPLSTLPFCACMSVVSVGYLGFANNLVRGPDRFIWKAFPLVVIPAVTGHAIGVVRK